MDEFTILESASLKEALEKIEKNKHGIILTIEEGGSVVGLATDGDIRRKLLRNTSLSEPISNCTNSEFIWADEATPRELLLKQLDQRIKVIPILNAERKLVNIISRDFLPVQVEERIYSRARSPVRISFGGGGSDLTHYFIDHQGAVINSTISLYSHATLRIREDSKVIIHSRDIGASLIEEDLRIAYEKKGKFSLILAVLKSINPDFGFELFLHSDFPMNSGLGGSSVIASAILGCFNQFRRDKWDMHELAELAFQAERLYLNISGGWQDQYATVFGGFNFMEFKMDQNIVHPLRISSDVLLELEESLILCDTRCDHNSGDIHLDQQKRMKQDDIRDLVQSNVELTYIMRNLLLRGKLYQFGQCLNEAWKIKRKLSDKISNDRIDGLYDKAIQNGAVGGKLLGAGGGGFFIFYAPPFQKFELSDCLVESGLNIQTFRFESDGLQAWSIRDRKII